MTDGNEPPATATTGRRPSAIFIVVIALILFVGGAILYIQRYHPILFEQILNDCGIDTGYSEQGIIRRLY